MLHEEILVKYIYIRFHLCILDLRLWCISCDWIESLDNVVIPGYDLLFELFIKE